MFGYKVVGIVGTSKQSCAQLSKKYNVVYIPGKFVIGKHPLWYFSTLKQAVHFIRHSSFLKHTLQIWQCEVKKSNKILKNSNFEDIIIERFWERVRKLGIRKYNRGLSTVRVAEEIKLIKQVTENINYRECYNKTIKITRRKGG